MRVFFFSRYGRYVGSDCVLCYQAAASPSRDCDICEAYFSRLESSSLYPFDKPENKTDDSKPREDKERQGPDELSKEEIDRRLIECERLKMEEIRHSIERSRSYPERLRYEQEPKTSRSYDCELKSRFDDDRRIDAEHGLSYLDGFDRSDDYRSVRDQDEYRSCIDDLRSFDQEPKIRLEPEGRSAVDSEMRTTSGSESRYDSDDRSDYDTARSMLEVEMRSRCHRQKTDAFEPPSKIHQEIGTRFDLEIKQDLRFDDNVITYDPDPRYRSDVSDTRHKFDRPLRTRFEMDRRPNRLEIPRQDTDNNNRPLARSKSYYQPHSNDNLVNR